VRQPLVARKGRFRSFFTRGKQSTACMRLHAHTPGTHTKRTPMRTGRPQRQRRARNQNACVHARKAVCACADCGCVAVRARVRVSRFVFVCVTHGDSHLVFGGMSFKTLFCYVVSQSRVQPAHTHRESAARSKEGTTLHSTPTSITPHTNTHRHITLQESQITSYSQKKGGKE
jgi:hypothetical protein